MKKIVLFFLALTLVVMSCSADDTTGSGGAGSGSGAGNTAEAQAWKNQVAGKTYTYTYPDGKDEELEVVFDSRGLHKDFTEKDAWDDDGDPNTPEVAFERKVSFFIKQAESSNRVIIGIKYITDGVTQYEYVAYELDIDGTELKVLGLADYPPEPLEWEKMNWANANTYKLKK